MKKPLMVLAALMALLPVVLAGCSKPVPPTGKWEGGAESSGTIVAARMEILPGGQVKISAPDVTYVTGNRARIDALRAQLAADLANGWDGVKPRSFDFDGDTFRKPGGVAPQMKWDKASNQMTLQLYIGANPAFPVPLRPVAGFHGNPFASG